MQYIKNRQAYDVLEQELPAMPLMTNDHVRNMTPNLDALPENDFTKNKFHSGYGTE